MALEQQVPQEFVALTMQTFADHEHSTAQGNLADLRLVKRTGP